MPFLHVKHFSLEEARAALGEVRPLAEELVILKHRLDERGYDIYRHRYFGGTGPNGERYFPGELERRGGLSLLSGRRNRRRVLAFDRGGLRR